jgi:16S rRNA (uracil1498-N3)-methyltransferase
MGAATAALVLRSRITFHVSRITFPMAHRFHLPPDQCRDDRLFLTGREAHHALRVLRLRHGDRIVVLDGAGAEIDGKIEDFDRDKVRVAVVERRFVDPLPYQLTLLQAIPKGKTMETILQKATELGATRIVPLLSERVVTQLDEGETAKTARWQSVVVEAIKQCGAAWLPRLEPPLSPQTFLARKEAFDLLLVASLGPGAEHPRVAFGAFQARHNRMPRSVAVAVGPEGDFTVEEVEAFVGAGAAAITLGRLVLRSDTAAIYCLSVLSYELQASLPTVNRRQP